MYIAAAVHPDIPIAQNVLWLLAIGAYAVVVLKLRVVGLFRVYPFFFAYLIFRVAQNIALYGVPYYTEAYAWTYFLSEPVSWVLYVLVVLELYSLVLRGYKGIASVGRWVMMSGLLVSIVISAVSLRADLGNPAERYKTILYFTAVERGVVSSLVIFLFVIAIFLVVYPVPLSRNTLVHAIAYSTYFLSITMAYLIRNMTGAEVNVAVNLLLTGITIACLAIWALFLSREGEVKTVAVRQHWRAEQEEKLLDQLGALNATLLRAARK